jgi:hypothetical protein
MCIACTAVSQTLNHRYTLFDVICSVVLASSIYKGISVHSIYLVFLSPSPVSFLCIHNLTRKLTPRSDPRTVEYKDPRHDCQQRANTTQQATCRSVTQLRVHLLRDQREHTTWQSLVLAIICEKRCPYPAYSYKSSAPPAPNSHNDGMCRPGS